MPSKKFHSQNSERTHYFRGLRIFVGGTKQVENEKLNREINTEVFRKHWNSMIWLELQVILFIVNAVVLSFTIAFSGVLIDLLEIIALLFIMHST